MKITKMKWGGETIVAFILNPESKTEGEKADAALLLQGYCNRISLFEGIANGCVSLIETMAETRLEKEMLKALLLARVEAYYKNRNMEK